MRSHQAVFHRGRTILHSHKPCMRVLISSHTCFLPLPPFIAILVGSQWYTYPRGFFGLRDIWKFHPLVHFPFAFCFQCLQGHKDSWHVYAIYHVLGALSSSSLVRLQSIDAPDSVSNPDSSAQTSQKVIIKVRLIVSVSPFRLEIGRIKFLKPCTSGNTNG